MDFDEQSDSGFPVALSAPGQSNVTEKGIDSAFAYSLESCMVAPLHAPGRVRTHVDSGVMVFGSHCSPRCTQAPTARFATRLHSTSTTH
jgi:hypothetical protein